MKLSSDSNDILPTAILYFYPPDQEIKKQKLLDCGEIVGAVQYFQRDLFRSIARTLYFQKSLVAHEHFGRHSGFLSVPDDRYTAQEAHIYLQHILNLFNMLYGPWNHVQSIYEQEDSINDFLDKALTPIVKYVFSQHRSISNLFSTIEYTLLKSGNQRVLLESKHYLGYLKTKYGLHDGFLGYDDKILYSTCNSDTTYYLQLLFQLNNELSENLMAIPWESEFRLRTGVSVFRVHILQQFIPKPAKKISTKSKTNIPTVKITKDPIDISDILIPEFDNIQSPSNVRPRLNIQSSITDKNRLGVIIKTDQSASSDETGFDTDTPDELLSPTSGSMMTRSLMYLSDNANYLNTEDSSSSSDANDGEEAIPDDVKVEKLRSRSSTKNEEGDMEKTVKIERKGSTNEPFSPIELVQIGYSDTSDDDEVQKFHIHNRTSFDHIRDRTLTVTTNPDLNIKDMNDFDETQVTWTNVPDKNIEHQRDELVLYIQRNSRMIFAGLFEESLLTEDYLNKLWSLMISQMANMVTEIQAVPTANELPRLSTDVKFHFNEHTRHAEFERISDGTRYFRRIPSEESTYMALFARTELNRNPERKVIGLSRGSHFVSIDRRLPDRISYSCRRFQETL